jgi:hypothetical protein
LHFGGFDLVFWNQFSVGRDYARSFLLTCMFPFLILCFWNQFSGVGICAPFLSHLRMFLRFWSCVLESV